ncbi:MAG: hypothetical protein O7A08_11985 [SAR324 cluster bacterium]|nr:hypothetical protein [SAR324 cluster bacterium]MCZ6533670.1 hypothetical protein [SAR324 cluster bacterium]MCZ6558152.1 hypothetical protein [SAR324 cluster bacterium]MCZ6628927.1 hypothetical protein [SAR324 cluster bacterium]MCZ6647363.1 hypothetical protein [SAR324 cluster bacterium]
MNRSYHRIGLYLAGGGLLLTWLQLPEGVLGVLTIIAMIVVFAYVDTLLRRHPAPPINHPKVVSMGAFRARQSSRSAGAMGPRERKVLRPVYNSIYYGDVDSLLQILRAEGLNPMMVTNNSSGAKNGPLYMIMLPDREIRRAKPLIDVYVVQTAKTPS